MATPKQFRKRGRWSLIIGTLFAVLTFGAVMASGAELFTAELVAPNNDVTVTQGSSTNFTISVSATGNISQAITSGSPSTATVRTSYSLSAGGVLSSSTPSSAMNFWASGTGCTSGVTVNCDVTWTGAPTAYSVSASVSANALTPVGNYTITLSEAAGTTSTTDPAVSGGKLDDGTATTITVHVVAPVVTNNPPTVDAGGGYSGGEGSEIALDGASASDPGGSIASSLWSIDSQSAGSCSLTNAASLLTATINCTDNGTAVVKLLVTDNLGATNSDTANVTINNVAPTGTLGNDGPVNEGSPANITFTGQSDPSSVDTTAGFHYAFSCTNADLSGTTYASALNLTGSTTCTYNDDGTNMVSGAIVDKDDGVTTYTTVVTVNNVAPTVTNLIGDTNVNESTTATHTYTYDISDPGVDTETGNPSCGSLGTISDASNTDTGGTFKCTFPDGLVPATASDVNVSATDSDGDTGNTAHLSVTVNNVAPTVTLDAGNTYTWLESSTARTFNFSVSDPSADTYSATADPSCGTGGSYVASSLSTTGNSGSQTGSFDCTFPDGPATPTISISFTDDDGGVSTAATHGVTVNNVKPSVTIDSLTGNSGAACVTGNTVTLGFHWTDPALTNDTYSYDVNWGDATSHPTGSSATSPVSGLTHSYAAGGPYTIVVTVNDEDPGAGGTASSSAFSFLYNVSGILQPINLTGPRSSFKIGSTIPVKIKVTDCSGASVSGLTLKVKLQKLDNSAAPSNEAVEVSVPDVGDMMRYDSTGMQYIYNLSTKRSQLLPGNVDLTAGSYRVTVYGPTIASMPADFDAK